MHPEAAALLQWATWSGQHALALSLALLAALLALSYAGWWSLRRYSAARRQSSISSAAICSVVFLAGSGVFVLLAGQLAADGEIIRADLALTAALRASVAPPVVQVFAVLTRFGDPGTRTGLCIAVAILLLMLGRRWLALGWVVTLAGGGLLNQVLKQVFDRARPLSMDGSLPEPGFSFPSGHSSGTLVACGMLAYLVLRLLPSRWHLPAVLATVALSFTVGASRVFLGVHFASDVIAGFASGIAWLTFCIGGIELLLRCRGASE